MDKQIYIANTYLKVLTRSSHTLLEPLLEALGPNALSLLEDEFLYGADIDRVFKQFSDHGLDSWLLRYGKDLSIASHGPLGFAVLSAPDLQTAMHVLSDYIVIRSSAYKLEFVQNGKRAECVFVDHTSGDLTGRWLIETAIRLAQQLIENVLAHSLGDHALISFAHSAPPYKEELNALLGVRCHFNAESNNISFPASWCQISSPLSDQETFKTNLIKCRELKLALNCSDQFSEAIALALINYFEAREQGNLTIEEMPSLHSLAKKHHVSSRTLNRRLKEQNTSYKELLADARKAQAGYFLQNTHLTIADISYNLAYQEPANFVRAFKTWFDMTPGVWRRQYANAMNKTESNNER